MVVERMYDCIDNDEDEHNRKPPRQLVCIVFGEALDQMGEKCRYLAENASFGPKLAVFGHKIQFWGGRE